MVSTSCKQDLGRPLKRTPNFSCDAVIRDEFSSQHLLLGARKVDIQTDYFKFVQTAAHESTLFKLGVQLELRFVIPSGRPA